MDSDTSGIAQAVQLLRNGGAVALPTETVYGLAADARNADAVAQIYRIKGRPDFNPLIVHVADLAAAEAIALFDASARALAAAFWPGALTLVLPLRAGAGIAPAVTAGLPTIALRCPAHPVMQSVLRESGLALAAPSANRSGAISPSCADHVAHSLGDRVELILDGGPTALGLESTIVAQRDSGSGWQILREGPVTKGQISNVLGEEPATMTSALVIEAPGQLSSHYAPSKPLLLEVSVAQSTEFHIGFGTIAGDYNLSPAGDLAEAASRLYAALHMADASSKSAIAVAPVPMEEMGAAINDRLRRAATAA